MEKDGIKEQTRPRELSKLHLGWHAANFTDIGNYCSFPAAFLRFWELTWEKTRNPQLAS